MNFKNWLEDASLGAMTPEMMPPIGPNRGSETPASDQVKQTGLQPQVDAQELETKSKKEQDAISAIDSDIEHMDSNLPEGDDEDTPKLNRFKKLWDELKAKWDEIKMSDDTPGTQQDALGNADDQKYTQMMMQHPNMVPVGNEQTPHGPGIFGQS